MRCKQLVLGLVGLMALGLLTACEVDDMTINDGAAKAAVPAGGMDLAISSAALSASDIDSATVTIYSSQAAYDPANPGNDSGTGVDETFPISVTMTCTEGSCSGHVDGVPAGTGRYVVASASMQVDTDTADTDTSTTNEVIFEGTALVDVVAGETASVTVIMHEMTKHEPFENTTPLITALAVSDREVATGEAVTMIVTANDPDPQDALTFTWVMSDGTSPVMIATSQGTPVTTQTVTWSSNTAGSYGLTLVVTDGKQLSSTVSFQNLITVYGVGGVDVTLDPDEVPEIDYIDATPAVLASGASTELDLVFDDDSTSWTYAWTTTCDGAFNDATLEDPVLVLNDTYNNAVQVSCTVSVLITDNATNEASGTITLFVGQPPFIPTEGK